MLDLLIKNGDVIDGTGARRVRADVAVQGERIVDVGNLPGAAARVVIDATSHVVTPGFVDMHSHADMGLATCPTANSSVHQGITTVWAGHCGVTPAPLYPETRDAYLKAFGQSSPEEMEITSHWSTFGSFLDYLQKLGTSPNVVALVGQGAIRGGIIGFDAAPPTPAQMERLQSEVEKALDEGAVGVSTGLIYPPGSYAKTDELIDFTRPVGKRHGIYASHIRGEGDTLLDAIAEAIRIGRETGAATHISHFKAAGRDNWDKVPAALQLIEKARTEGLDVTTDMYPHLAGGTSLLAILPEWAQEGGPGAALKRLADPETRKRMTEDMKTKGFFRIAEFDKVLIYGPEERKDLAGVTVADLAASKGKSPYDTIFDTLLEVKLQAGMMLFMMSEENVRLQLKYPRMMIGTDGGCGVAEGHEDKQDAHPRSYGTFPQVLGRYVREQRILSLEDAVHRMSGLPAQRFGWTDRGLVKKGYCADLVVLNPDTVAELSTYQRPNRYPAGIPHVVVNGQLVVSDGKHTQARPGKILGR